MAEHNALGKEGEGEAVAYLRDKGYAIRHCNWRAGRLELDIVAEKNGELIVVEVKTRRNEEYGTSWLLQTHTSRNSRLTFPYGSMSLPSSGRIPPIASNT